MSDRANKRPLDVGILVHRYSGDAPTTPTWPGVGRASVFDPVAAVFFDAASGRARLAPRVLRRALDPVDPTELRKMTTVDSLTSGR